MFSHHATLIRAASYHYTCHVNSIASTIKHPDAIQLSLFEHASSLEALLAALHRCRIRAHVVVIVIVRVHVVVIALPLHVVVANFVEDGSQEVEYSRRRLVSKLVRLVMCIPYSRANNSEDERASWQITVLPFRDNSFIPAFLARPSRTSVWPCKVGYTNECA